MHLNAVPGQLPLARRWPINEAHNEPREHSARSRRAASPRDHPSSPGLVPALGSTGGQDAVLLCGRGCWTSSRWWDSATRRTTPTAHSL